MDDVHSDVEVIEIVPDERIVDLQTVNENVTV